MKKGLKIFLLAIVVILISGCGEKTEWKKSDIEEYINKNYGITGYKMPDKATKEKINDNITENAWKIEYKDITFKVYEYQGGFLDASHLHDDFYNSVMDYYAKKYGSEYNLKYEYTTGNNGDLICNVTSNDDDGIKKCYDNMYNFINKIDFETYPVKFILAQVKDSNNKNIFSSRIYSDGKIKTYEEFKK